MFDKWQYVQKRHNKYGVRVPVPLDLQSILHKKEITRSLKTGDPDDAKRIYHEVMADIHALFDTERDKLTPPAPAELSPETALILVRDHYREVFYQTELDTQSAINDVDLTVEGLRSTSIEVGTDAALRLRQLHSDGPTSVGYITDSILKGAGFPTTPVTPRFAHQKRRHAAPKTKANVDRKSEGYISMLRLTHQAEVELCNRIIAAVEDKPFDTANSLLANEPRFINLQPTRPSIAVPEPVEDRFPIFVGDLLERFFEAHPNKSGRWSKDIRVAFRALFELHGGETKANNLIRADFRNLLNFTRRLPRQIGNSTKRWAGMSLREIIVATESNAEYEDALLHPVTVNKYMGRVSQVFSWAEQEPLIDRNHASGVRIPSDEIDDDDVKRLPFDDATLNQLFATPVFSQPKHSSPSMYWAVLIGLLQGMRCEEILQLTATDMTCPLFEDHS